MPQETVTINGKPIRIDTIQGAKKARAVAQASGDPRVQEKVRARTARLHKALADQDRQTVQKRTTPRPSTRPIARIKGRKNQEPDPGIMKAAEAMGKAKTDEKVKSGRELFKLTPRQK